MLPLKNGKEKSQCIRFEHTCTLTEEKTTYPFLSANENPKWTFVHIQTVK